MDDGDIERKVDEFLTWLEWTTQFGKWGILTKKSVRNKLIEILKS